MLSKRSLLGLCLAVLVPVVDLDAQGGEMFESVAKTLSRRFYKREFRREKLPALIEAYREAAHATRTLNEERNVIHAMLREIPASHLALYSRNTYDELMASVFGKPRTSFCFELVQRRARFYATSVLDGGPAAKAGLRDGDQVLALDGVFPGKSERLDWRNDDAHLPDLPVHYVVVGDNPKLHVLVRRGGKQREMEIDAKNYTGVDASRASVNVVEGSGLRIGYVHLWMIFNGSSQFLIDTFHHEFRTCDGILLDLRGHGGNGIEAGRIVQFLRRHARTDPRPVVAIVDHSARSAKEIIAFQIKRGGAVTLVGEHTAGAAVPATFATVGHHSVLMYPSFTLGAISTKVELIGIEPDVKVDASKSDSRHPFLAAGIAELVEEIARKRHTRQPVSGNEKKVDRSGR